MMHNESSNSASLAELAIVDLQHRCRTAVLLLHLTDIVEVTMGGSFLGQELLVSIQADVQVELLLLQHEAMVTHRLHRPLIDDLEHPASPGPHAGSLERVHASAAVLQDTHAASPRPSDRRSHCGGSLVQVRALGQAPSRAAPVHVRKEVEGVAWWGEQLLRAAVIGIHLHNAIHHLIEVA